MIILIGSILQGLATNFAVKRITQGLRSLSNYRNHSRRLKNYLTDKKLQVELSRVDRYKAEPTGAIDMEFFNDISAMSDAICFESIDNSQNILRVKGDSLPTPLEIRIEAMPAFEDGMDSVPRYEVIVKTYTEMVFGYRSDAPLDEFRTLSEDISDAVQQECFDNSSPEKTFLTGKIQGQLPTEKDQIEDEEIQMRAKINDNEIEMTFRDPRNLTRGIQKYFQPL